MSSLNLDIIKSELRTEDLYSISEELSSAEKKCRSFQSRNERGHTGLLASVLILPGLIVRIEISGVSVSSDTTHNVNAVGRKEIRCDLFMEVRSLISYVSPSSTTGRIHQKILIIATLAATHSYDQQPQELLATTAH
ncbi:hypothetical protein F511_03185 [Dorcoceras hygrometricum]|uniref:Uncharacterized protein n=1 Tax=Dorcoceras hygrometricum TaxID=472368 RepID=A0A2Z7CT35_9LAMI|nr:hypothetical protein F511_03185 [Dorcoceras hygrometricum]